MPVAACVLWGLLACKVHADSCTESENLCCADMHKYTHSMLFGSGGWRVSFSSELSQTQQTRHQPHRNCWPTIFWSHSVVRVNNWSRITARSVFRESGIIKVYVEAPAWIIRLPIVCKRLWWVLTSDQNWISHWPNAAGQSMRLITWFFKFPLRADDSNIK